MNNQPKTETNPKGAGRTKAPPESRQLKFNAVPEKWRNDVIKLVKEFLKSKLNGENLS